MTRSLLFLLGLSRLTAFVILYPSKIITTTNGRASSALFSQTSRPLSTIASVGDVNTNMQSDRDGSISTLKLLEHVNLNVPNQKESLPFYSGLLGMGLDPRRAGNVCKGSGTAWLNCGASQFHLPFDETAQCLPGSIGLLYESLDPLKARLEEILKRPESDRRYLSHSEVTPDHVRLVDKYGNVFYAREKRSDQQIPGSADNWKQPLVQSDDALFTENDVAAKYGRTESECLGIHYVEFDVPPRTAARIAQFYECVLDATVSVVDNDYQPTVAMVAFGQIDTDTGRADQYLLFREISDDDEPIPPYDGHHISMYVGNDFKDFEVAFKNCETAGVVWVNPRFSDKAPNLTGAKIYNQFRFKDILDIKTGNKIFTLENEMRTVDHDACPGKKKE